MVSFLKNRFLSILVFFFTVGTLSIVQLKIDSPIIIAERFMTNGGWIEIVIVGIYGALIASKMENHATATRWRVISWTLFSIFFFLQLLLGIIISEKFLMSGKLHLPVPAMILIGPIYRGQISFMTLLFLCTVLFTGPAWCSHLCYFGAIDNLIAKSANGQKKIKNKHLIKNGSLLLIIGITLILRIFKINAVISTIAGIIFGLTGILIMIIFSRKKGKMIHCTLYCPIGTLVNYLKKINPFRIYIGYNCSYCGSCISVCKYDALNLTDLKRKKPADTCTLCGDCINVCHINSIYYKLFFLNPANSRKLYLFITVSFHAIFLAMAKI